MDFDDLTFLSHLYIKSNPTTFETRLFAIGEFFVQKELFSELLIRKVEIRKREMWKIYLDFFRLFQNKKILQQRQECQLSKDQRLVSNAKLIAPIGKGRFGRVYKAITDEGQLIVVKIIQYCKRSNQSTFKDPADEEMKSEALNEAKIHESLHHENIVTLLSYNSRENCIVVNMNHFDGEPLWRFLRRKHFNIGEKNAIEIFNQLCSAVKYLHEMNIAHGDLHLGNVLVNDNHVVKLIDFGMAAIGEASSEKKDGDIYDLNSIQHMLYVTSRNPGNIKESFWKQLYKWGILQFYRNSVRVQ